MDRLFIRLLVSVVLSIQLSGPAFASLTPRHVILTNGAISGKITQADGVSPISNATVKALQGTTTIATTTTNTTGDYTLPDLAPGSYRLEASATGFGTKSQAPVSVTDGGNTTLNLSLVAIVSGPVSYIYDALGRLVAMVGPTDTTIYSYDAVGNLLSITRQASSQLSIVSVVPNRGKVGQLVTIYGTGFSATPAQNNVQFDNVSATVLSSTSTRIIATVPSLSVTGQIQIAVTTSQGTATAPFTVLPGSSAPTIQVAPGSISILPGEKVQFFASITGLSGDQSLTWSVNGVNGGNNDFGTISATGFYSSPTLPSSIFVIRATSVANPSIFGQAQVAILNSALAEALISRSVSVFRRAPVESSVGSSLSVRRLPATDTTSLIASAVSVRRLSPTDSAAPVASGVSVRRNDAVTAASTASAAVSLTTGPTVQAVSPSSGAKNTSLTLTLSGVNFTGATALSFLTTGGAIDSAITASNIQVNAEGTSLTATITISSTAAVGQRVVVIVTPAGHSLAVNVGPNVIEIIP